MKWVLLHPLGDLETATDFMCKNVNGESEIIDLFVDGGWPENVKPQIGMEVEIDSISPLTFSTKEKIEIVRYPKQS